MIIYGIKNCDSVKKAKRWLDAHNVVYHFHDFREAGLDESTIRQWLESVDWEDLVNKRGTTWRNLEDKQKTDLSEASAIELMLENPTLIKRPVAVSNATTLVGFNEQQYQQLL